MVATMRYRRKRFWQRRVVRAVTALAAGAFVVLGVQLLGAQGETRSPAASAAPLPADALALQAACQSPESAAAQVCVSAAAAPAVVPEVGLPVALAVTGAVAMMGAVALTARRGGGPMPVDGGR